MSWWRRTELVPVTQEQAIVQRSIAFTVADKFKNREVYAAISSLRDAVIRLPIEPETRRRYGSNSSYSSFREPYPHRRTVCQRFSFLSRKLQTVDYNRADSRSLMLIVEILNEKAPKLIHAMETEFTLEGWSGEAWRLDELTGIIETAIKEATKLPSTLSTLYAETVNLNGELLASEIVFPDISQYAADGYLTAELTKLQEDWETAHSLPLEAEDEFTVEQVALSYLPDALTLYERFRRRTGELAAEKAQALLLEQLQLIHKQVQFVLEQHTDDSFSMMEAHTNFLKAKNAQLGIQQQTNIVLESTPVNLIKPVSGVE